MNTAFIMCSRKECDCVPFRVSLFENPGVIDLRLQAAPYITEVVGAPSMGHGYNRGIEVAKIANRAMSHQDPDVFVFTHSDVRIWAGKQLWHNAVRKAMEPTTGFVGVAGSNGLGKDGMWWLGNGPHGAVAHQHDNQVYTSSYGEYGQARVMDGVFLMCGKHVLEAIGPWPEDLGWHFYDIWATERADRLGLKNWVMPLPLLHLSIGESAMHGDWKDSRDLYMVKYHASRTFGI